jgi:HTH-type transcriptional regulator/antitoxin HigA
VITNERQYAITQVELQPFDKAGRGIAGESPAAGIDPRIGEAVVDSLKGQAETLRDEIKRYEDLRDGRIGQRELGSLRDFPTALIEARIVAGLTQKQRGERLEVKEQQIQRWEANLYSGVGVERLQKVADALGMKVKETVSYAATRITVRPDQMDGASCVRGLRIPVATVVDMVAEGMSESEIVAAYPDLEGAADVRAVISCYRPRRNRDRNFALAGNFERIDPDSRPVSEIPEDELMRGFGE